ncbi:ATP-binding protein [Streptosporangium sp. NPDC000396]|uniref:ATP-binding protein n=1 Tax=Streptosporangium sp. NPDC000396 TaxID=3366185 RepID=UPI003676AB46
MRTGTGRSVAQRSPLIGRHDEIRQLGTLIDAAGQGRGGALVLRGEPGVGKSALLGHIRETAAGFQVVHASGAEFEMELPFAALHQLCAPALDHLAALPAPHRKALEIAFGLDTGTPDPFLVGIATLGLLVETVRERPLLCVVDDAQWLDHASAKALAFLARRVAAERVAVVFSLREPSRLPELDGLPSLTVEGLSEADARALLAAEIRAPLDERVRDRILAEARGNPLALLELPRSVGLTGMAGGFALPDTPPLSSPLSSRIEQSFQARLERLPAGTRLLLTVAAADPVGDPALLWRAAGLLGLDVTSAGPAEASALVEFGTRIRFCHPLARSAVYRAAGLDERRRAHHALAAATDPMADPDRLAWHRAQAGAGPDEDVAAELEHSAARAQARGGVAAAAAFLERSAELTLDPERRTERVLAAAQAKLIAGAFDAAAELLTAAETGPLDQRQLARIDLLRGRISFVRHRGGDGATTYLLRAARRLADSDPKWSRACYLDALEMGMLTGGMDTIIAAARSAPPAPQPPDSADAVLDGLVSLATDGHRVAIPPLRPIVADVHDEVWVRRPSLASLLSVEVWDFDAYIGTAEHLVEVGRSSGSFHLLPIGLAMLAAASAHAGDFGAAMELISEGEAIAEVTGASPLVYSRLHLAALRGRRQEATELFTAVLAASQRMSLSVHWATAVLNNGLGDYPAALESARRAVELDDLALSGLALPELVEAAVRCGEHDLAASALESLAERTRAGGAAWGLGVEAYARALVTDNEDAYREAAEHLDGCRAAVYRARAHLLYGEWLRRQGRRRDARERLRLAHELLSGMGAEAFADRAAGELRATGEHARSRSSQASEQLTMQEVHIARLVADGATSKEVAARLFLSPRTVDAHLRNIFRKLGLTSRKQLRNLPEIR